MQELKTAFKEKNIKILLEKIKVARFSFGVEPLNFQELIDSGLITILIRICDLKEFNDDYELIYETLWIISNALSGDSNTTQILIDEGVIEVLKKTINSENLVIREMVKTKKLCLI